MVSFIDVLKRLIPGDYFTGTGYPNAESDFKYFVDSIRSRIPELSKKEDWEIEDTVIAAIEWAINNLCRRIKYEIEKGVNKLREYGLFECYHPETGKFYLVFDEDSDGDIGAWHLGFSLTTSRKEAEEIYESLK